MFKSPTQPLCRSCGKPIAKKTTYHRFTDSENFRGQQMDFWKVHICAAKDRPQTRDQLRRFTNEPVVSAGYSQKRDFDTDKLVGPRTIYKFTTWDGESYVDSYFCNGTCEREFARTCARAGHVTKAYADALRRRNPPTKAAA